MMSLQFLTIIILYDVYLKILCYTQGLRKKLIALDKEYVYLIDTNNEISPWYV